MPPALTVTKHLTHRCGVCGIAISSKEIAFEISGRYIDYTEHVSGPANILLCGGCREKLLQNLGEEQGIAILRRLEIEGDGKKSPPPINTDEAHQKFLGENPFGIEPPDGTGAGI